MSGRLWANRWLRAGLAALALAVWPAWMLLVDRHVEVDAAERANLDFVLPDMDGHEIDLSDFAGRPLVINFWATWCGPCKHEIPAFVDLVNRYGDQGFTVLGISIDDSAEELKPFAETYGMNYPVLMAKDHEDILEAYAAGFFLPTSWFVRRDGTVAYKHAGTQTPAWFEEQVQALLHDTEPAGS